MMARPAVSAVRTSLRAMLVLLGGSTRVMIGVTVRAACEVAYWSAVYQFVKKLLMAIERGVSLSFSLAVHGSPTWRQVTAHNSRD